LFAYENSKELFEWCRIPPAELPQHPAAKVKLKIVPTAQDVYRAFAQEMLEEVKSNNAAGRLTRWILPCGPRGEYPLFIEQVNRERISLKRVHVFHMDDHLDWQGRHLPLDHPFCLKGWMLKKFYGPIDADLNVPEEQRYFPHVSRVEEMSEKIEAVGGVDTMYGGIGYRGHIAYNEPPRSPWYRVSVEEFRNSTTRILHLNEDTLIALSHRAAGGCSDIVAPMAITLGMRELLGARRIRLYSETGAWKQTVIRILLFGKVSPEVPVTYCQEHPDCVVTVDEATAACPPLGI
jgi:glucosamine-6-phosphate deaminase